MVCEGLVQSCERTVEKGRALGPIILVAAWVGPEVTWRRRWLCAAHEKAIEQHKRELVKHYLGGLGGLMLWLQRAI